jgi:hypothetical protein
VAAEAAADVVDRVQPPRRIEMKYIRQLLQAVVVAVSASTLLHAADAPKPSAAPANKSGGTQKTFASADDAAKALAEAVRAKDVDALVAIVGPGSKSWLLSGDKVQDRNDWERFLAAYDQKHAIGDKDGKAVLEVGDDAWPFPAPIVKHGDKFAFDTNAGRDEIVNRRVGRNELDAIQTLLAIVDAQREYAATDADGNGFADYAKKFRSSPGKKDGLFWPTESGQKPSPLGPLVATAAREGYGKDAKKDAGPAAYHGYHYKILTRQGKSAPGGAFDYMVGDKLLGGFAVIAWPATYRVSGVTTFLVNYDGTVYEKDLGAQTGSIASATTVFNPDNTWRKAQ